MLSVLHLYLKRNCWEPYKCTLINVLFTEAYTDLLKYPLLVLGTKPVGSALGAGYTAVCADLQQFGHQVGKTFLSSNSCFMIVSPPARVLLLILISESVY